MPLGVTEVRRDLKKRGAPSISTGEFGPPKPWAHVEKRHTPRWIETFSWRKPGERHTDERTSIRGSPEIDARAGAIIAFYEKLAWCVLDLVGEVRIVVVGCTLGLLEALDVETAFRRVLP